MYVRDKNNRIVTGRGGQPVRAGNIAQVSQTPPLQGGYAPPAAPQARPGVGQQLQGMALNKGINAGMEEAQAFAQPYMDKGLAYGKEALSGLGSMFGGGAGASAAGTGAASGGMGAMMGAAGTAMPYVGMGILAGKALGFFNKGGYIGPLSKASYAANGEKMTAEFQKAPEEIYNMLSKQRSENMDFGSNILSDAYTENLKWGQAMARGKGNYDPTMDIYADYLFPANDGIIEDGLKRERLIDFIQSQGPLAPQYKANGEKIGVEFLNEYNKDEMSKLSPLQKTQIRQQAVRKAQGMNPEDRAKYVDGLRSRGIDSESMSSSGNNNNKSILEQFFGIK